MIKNINELNALRDKNKEVLKVRFEEGADFAADQKQILVCGVAGCLSSGSLKVAEAMEQQIKENHREEQIKLIKTGCMGPVSYTHLFLF